MKKYKIYTLPDKPCYKNCYNIKELMADWVFDKYDWKCFTRDKLLCRIGDYGRYYVLKENSITDWDRTNAATALKTMEALRRTKVFN